ncbi:hypothetical protein V8C86DRAFT_2612812, partial [Haematococcus lacustris]
MLSASLDHLWHFHAQPCLCFELLRILHELRGVDHVPLHAQPQRLQGRLDVLALQGHGGQQLTGPLGGDAVVAEVHLQQPGVHQLGDSGCALVPKAVVKQPQLAEFHQARPALLEPAGQQQRLRVGEPLPLQVEADPHWQPSTRVLHQDMAGGGFRALALDVRSSSSPAPSLHGASSQACHAPGAVLTQQASTSPAPSTSPGCRPPPVPGCSGQTLAPCSLLALLLPVFIAIVTEARVVIKGWF